MRKISFALIVFALLFSAKSFAQEFSVSRGETLVIKSSDVSGAEKLLFRGAIYYKSNSGEFIIGADLNAKPGSYPLFLLDKAGKKIKEVEIQILDKEYPKYIFNFIPAIPVSREKRKAEIAKINQGYTQIKTEDAYEIGKFALPFEPYRITNEFGVERMYKNKKNPKLNFSEFHRGVDLAGPEKGENETIKAVNKGRIVLIGKKFSAEGNMVMIDHGLGIVSVYLHLKSFAKGLEESQMIEKGAPVGIMGSTGHSHGQHLHLMLKINGQVVDPLEFIEKINSSFLK